MSELDDKEFNHGRLTERERAKLPVWAQDRLRNLRYELETAQKHLDELRKREGRTTVAYGDIYNNPKFLPDSPYHAVTMSLDGSTEPQDKVWITVRRQLDEVTRQPLLEVTGSHSLAVTPQASNMLRVYPFYNGRIVEALKNPEVRR